MESGDAWRSLFENWPDSVPRQGLVVTKFEEAIPFTDFLLSPGILLVQRDRPDSSGARKVLLGYDTISAVKITSTMELAQFEAMGFQAPL